MPETPDFIRRQRAFAAHLRDPDAVPAPDGIEERRLRIYRDLVLKNLSSLLSGSFPVLHRILPASEWQGLMRDFLRRHRAQTPLFHELPQEFLEFLATSRRADPRDPPFLLELAHYEWVELAVRISDAEPSPDGVDPQGDLLAGRPVLSPLARCLTYRFPVHRIGPEHRPDGPPPEPTHLVVYRASDGRVAYLEINAVTQRLLMLIAEAELPSGSAMLRQIADELGHPSPERLIGFGMELMADLRERGVLLGAERT